MHTLLIFQRYSEADTGRRQSEDKLNLQVCFDQLAVLAYQMVRNTIHSRIIGLSSAEQTFLVHMKVTPSERHILNVVRTSSYYLEIRSCRAIFSRSELVIILFEELHGISFVPSLS